MRDSGARDGDDRDAPHAGREPEGPERSPERTVQDVRDRLAWTDGLDASEVAVSCENDEVTLEGTVDSRRAKRTAEDLAESVRGVRDVHNRLRIRRGDGEAPAFEPAGAETPTAGAPEGARP